MNKYILMAESGADLPQEIRDKYNVYVVPMHVTMGDVTKDDGSFPISELYGYYQKTGTLPKTSGSSPHDFQVAFDEVHAKYPDSHIIYLAYSAVTTCAYQSAQISAEGRDYITSIDTKQVSAGQTMVIILAAEYIKAHPDCTPEEIVAYVEGIRGKVHMGFFPGDLVYLKAGGRVSNAAYLGAKLLSLNPLIEINDGYLEATKKYRGKMNKVAAKFTGEFVEQYGFDRSLAAIVHSEGLDESIKENTMRDLKAMGFKEVIIVKTGSVVSTHSGPGGFGVIGFEKM